MITALLTIGIVIAVVVIAAVGIALSPWRIRLVFCSEVEELVSAEIRSSVLPIKIKRVLYPSDEEPDAEDIPETGIEREAGSAPGPEDKKDSEKRVEEKVKQKVEDFINKVDSAGSTYGKARPYIWFAVQHAAPELIVRLPRLPGAFKLNEMGVDAEVGLEDPELNGYICLLRQVLMPYVSGLQGLRVNFEELVIRGNAWLVLEIRTHRIFGVVVGVALGTVISFVRSILPFKRRTDMSSEKFMKTAMEELRSMVKSDVILGEPVRMGDDVLAIPVCKVRFGFGSGGANPKTDTSAEAFAGAGSVDPVGFLTIKGDSVQLLSFKSPTGTVDRLLDQVPGLVEKLSEMKQKKEGKAEDKAEEPPKE